MSRIELPVDELMMEVVTCLLDLAFVLQQKRSKGRKKSLGSRN